MIYLDNAASMPVRPEALKAAMPFLTENCANPSSLHSLGMDASMAIITAREQCAAALNCEPDEIIFTSGGTESNNTAIFSAAFSGGKRKIITSAIEHASVLMPCSEIERRGFEVIKLPPNGEGVISALDLERVIDDNTALVSVMTANNEIGTLQPIYEIAELCHKRRVLFHTDAVQAVGNVAVDLEELKADYLSVSGHKLGGFKGSGLLFARRDAPVTPLVFGGGQERGLRSGTENTAGIVSLGAAIESACRKIPEKQQKISALRNTLLDNLMNISNSHLNGSRTNRLAGNVNISFDGVESEPLVLTLDLMGVCASAGSACSAGKEKRSHVLEAMGLPESRSGGALRLTLSEYNTEAEIQQAAQIIKECVEKLRGER